MNFLILLLKNNKNKPLPYYTSVIQIPQVVMIVY